MSKEKKLSELNEAPYNPRKISDHQYSALLESIDKFGDISGIVFNRKTGNLVGGHQRIKAFKEIGTDKVVITEQLNEPNSRGTVARGYVINGDEKFTYREVEWTMEWEKMANVAANKIQGEWDNAKLVEVLADLEEINLTGFTEGEFTYLQDVFGNKDLNEDFTGKLGDNEFETGEQKPARLVLSFYFHSDEEEIYDKMHEFFGGKNAHDVETLIKAVDALEAIENEVEA